MTIRTDDLNIDDGNERIVSPGAGHAEAVIERALRPKQLDEYVGQSKARAQLEIFINATRNRKEALDQDYLGSYYC